MIPVFISTWMMPLLLTVSFGENTPVETPKEQENEPPRLSIEGVDPVYGMLGLQYWIIKRGTGERPTPDALVDVHYTGWLSDGSLYTTTRRQGRSSVIDLRRSIIHGMNHAILDMKVGGVRHVKIPPEMAFGVRGFTGRVPPNETLHFDIELLGLQLPPLPSSTKGIPSHTTESGLQYWDIKPGNGKPVGPDAVVTAKFTRWLTNGEMIDTTHFEGDESTFLLSQIIRGWAEGILTMKVGGIRQMRVPPQLAYGEAGMKPFVGPNATIIIEVEVISARTLKPKPGPKVEKDKKGALSGSKESATQN
ncbi:MAG: FKBP-type peptidyl-prolyl cis-trans isomerase [Planctomycetota bacterium]|jgi:peptidylprolyl isomerase